MLLALTIRTLANIRMQTPDKCWPGEACPLEMLPPSRNPASMLWKSSIELSGGGYLHRVKGERERGGHIPSYPPAGPAIPTDASDLRIKKPPWML